MPLRYLLLCVAITIAVGVGISGRHYAQRAKVASSAQDKTVQERRVIAAAFHTVKTRQASLEQERAALAKEQATLAAAAGTGEEASPSVAATANPEHALQRLQKDPELIALSLAARRATLTTNYGPFFRDVGLTPAQRDRFQALLIAREEQRADLQATRVSEKMGENDAAFATLQAQIQTEGDRAQRELLGDAAYRRLQEYERTLHVREMVSGIAGAAVLEGVPWTAAQAEQMIQLIATHGRKDAAEGVVDVATVNWALVDAAAQAILSPEQRVLFTTTQPPGPDGVGTRFQAILNHLINEGDKADAQRKVTAR